LGSRECSDYHFSIFIFILYSSRLTGGRLSVVWEEALAQIEQMIQYYDEHGAINTSYRDFRRATLGVIAHAGFNKVMEWVPLTAAIGNGKDGEGSYQECLHVLCENFIWAVIAPSWLLG